MSISPNRKQKQLLTAYKQTYLNSAHSTANPTTLKKEFRAQQSNIKGLNDVQSYDSEYWKKKALDNRATLLNQQLLRKKDRSLEDMAQKIEIIQRQNSSLLAENTALGEMINDKNAQIELLMGKLQNQAKSSSNFLREFEDDRSKSNQEMERKQIYYKQEIDKLLGEINQLHDQCYQIESTKNLEIQKIKQSSEKELFNQIQNAKRTHNGSVEMYQAQIRKLKQSIQIKSYELDNITHQNKLTNDKLNEQIKHLQTEIKHLNQIRDLELQECKMHYENQIHTKLREIKRSQQIQTSTVESTIKKLKKQIGDKSMEIQQLSTRLGKSTVENEEELQILKSDKEKLRFQLNYLEQSAKEQIKLERERINNLSSIEIQNIENSNTNYSNCLKSEIEKLYELTECKTTQIKDLYNQIVNIRKNNQIEVQYLENLNKQLTAKLDQMQLDNHEQLELLKIKMAQLHQADVASLKAYFQHQILLLIEQVASQERTISQNRDRIHKELQDKNELRKTFEIQLSKEKAKCADLRIKLAGASLEMKQQITSMASKMELTSQTFLRENKLKQKGVTFGEQQKRKLYQLMKVKDKQIHELATTLARIKGQFNEQKQRLEKQILDVSRFNQQLEEMMKKQHDFYQAQIQKRDQKYYSEKQQMDKQIKSIKTSNYSQLRRILENLEKEKLNLQKNLENSQRERNAMAQQLGLRNGYIQSMQLQSCAAIQEQKTKVKVLMNKTEISMKNYYEDKLKSREEEIASMKEQSKQKQQDLRDIVQKYNVLEKKLAMLLESQQKLRDFQNKVLNIGMDNNVIKNLAELFKNRK